MSTKRRKQLYEGKAKVMFEGPEPGTLIQYFKDDATAYNNQKRGVIFGKGVLNNRISEFIMTHLNHVGIPTHFIKSLNMREQLVRKVQIIPLEVIVRNVAAGSLCTRLGLKEGDILPKPVIEFCYKKDELGDPLVSEEHISSFGWAEPIEIEEIKILSTRINDFLSGMFIGAGIRLIDFKIEFGRIMHSEYTELVLADEISPDSCRLWDSKTNKKLDKDIFRRDLGDLTAAYMEVAKRLGIVIDPKFSKSRTSKKK